MLTCAAPMTTASMRGVVPRAAMRGVTWPGLGAWDTVRVRVRVRGRVSVRASHDLRAEEREAEEGRAGGEEQRRCDEGRDAPTPDLQG